MPRRSRSLTGFSQLSSTLAAGLVRLDLNQNEGDTMARDSDGVRSISGYNSKERTDAEKVEYYTKEIQRLERLLENHKRMLALAEKRLDLNQNEENQ